MAELITYREAVAGGDRARNSGWYCLGEDIGAAEGVFKTTVGLFTEFGAHQGVGHAPSRSRRSSEPPWARP